MEEDITKVSTVKLINEMTHLDHQIDLLLLQYEKVRLEVVRRFPQVEEHEEFKKKEKKL